MASDSLEVDGKCSEGRKEGDPDQTRPHNIKVGSLPGVKELLELEIPQKVLLYLLYPVDNED